MQRELQEKLASITYNSKKPRAIETVTIAHWTTNITANNGKRSYNNNTLFKGLHTCVVIQRYLKHFATLIVWTTCSHSPTQSNGRCFQYTTCPPPKKFLDKKNTVLFVKFENSRAICPHAHFISGCYRQLRIQTIFNQNIMTNILRASIQSMTIALTFSEHYGIF